MAHVQSVMVHVMADERPMWTVFVTYDEPDYPPGIQRTGRRRGISVSVRAHDEAQALVLGGRAAWRKGCEGARGEWAVEQVGG